jgi:uncharacterized protein YbjQ (UPF0145 family)
MTHNPDATVGVPAGGLKRLQQSMTGLFTSDLSVNEFLLVRDAGFEPLGFVMGSSIYHIGFQPPHTGGVELTTLSQAMYSARELAMSRLEAEASTLGADGVIGVRLDVGRHDDRPLLEEPQNGRSPHPRRATGDDGHLALQPFRLAHALSSRPRRPR